ncbi:MAG TPA: hypothetical protein VEZ14_09760 [Dehalococcoidia bacterium]|nr:hypothetical protein [Dehalococcoidia bacterium]
MAEGETVAPMPLDLPMPKWHEFDPGRFVLDYDKSADVLYVLPAQPRPATSIDLDEEVWLRLDLTTGEVLGFEFEAFQSVFLVKHPEIAAVWRRDHGRTTPVSEGKPPLLDALLNYLRSLMGSNNHPQQPRLIPNP